MTSREDIALQLTKAIIDNSTLSKINNPHIAVVNIFNGIYKGIETHNEKPIEILK